MVRTQATGVTRYDEGMAVAIVLKQIKGWKEDFNEMQWKPAQTRLSQSGCLMIRHFDRTHASTLALEINLYPTLCTGACILILVCFALIVPFITFTP